MGVSIIIKIILLSAEVSAKEVTYKLHDSVAYIDTVQAVLPFVLL